ncbi:MAG: electron transporter RnfD [Acidobacteria bacterium]|nr:MAG: electron transporter RnfD [Acidobacteriota bacterium]
MQHPKLVISTAPHLRLTKNTSTIMVEVLMALTPAVLFAIYYFGLSAIILMATTCIVAVGTEWMFSADKKKLGTLKDGSALLTGLLLALTLPPSIPVWMAVIGAFFAIALGKVAWGGLGFNMFNPALLGRAFLQAAFPEAMTTWTAAKQGFFTISERTFTAPLMTPPVDAFSAASPLGLSKFEGIMTDKMDLFLGNISGSLGETAAVAIIIGAIFLLIKKSLDWRLMVSTLLTVFIFSGILTLFVDRCPDPVFMILSGGILFGAVFMVTDPVTTPISSKGMWIFGFGVGFLVVLIRVYGGLPEAVMFSILIMNAVTPLINRFTQPFQFGGK